MYKTVRHGENSLQYTILPQTEEVLNNSGLKGKGRDYSPSIHVRRTRRRAHFSGRCVTILVFIAILIGGALALCILTGLPIGGDRSIIPASLVIPGVQKEPVKLPKKELKSVVVTTAAPKPESSSSTTTSTTSTTTTTTSTAAPTERTTTPPWVIPSLIIWKTSTATTTIPPLPTEDNNKIPLVGTPSGSIRLLDRYSVKPWEDIIIRPTVTPEPITIRTVFKYYSKSSEKPVTTNHRVFDDVLITTKPSTVRSVTVETTSESSKFKDLKETLLSVDDDDEFKESLEVDEVFSLPPLKPLSGTESDEVTVAKAGDAGWYGARWPFVDTSSYFQWTGYSPGDNLLLPLLVAALSSIALVLLLALAVRRRKRSYAASQQIGKLTADLQADDNTNLLAAENPEEGEE